jgi:hypothetical protein
MDYTQESVDALVAATQAAHDQLGVASVELAKAASLSSAAMDAAANLVHVSPPKPPTTLRKAYLGSSDFSALTGTTPTCHRHYYGLSGNGFNPQAALSRTQDDAKANRLTLLSIGPAGVAGKPDLNALSAFYPALKANPNLAFIPWHEPEDDKVTPADYNTWCKALITEARRNVPGLKTSYCFMAYTTRPGGPIQNWLNALDLSMYDYAGFDAYSNQATGTPAAPGPQWPYILKIAQDQHKPLIVAETGQNNDKGDPAVFWQNVLAFTQAHPEVFAVSWWPQKGPNGDHTPTAASKASFQNALGKDPYVNVTGAKV